MRIPGTRTTHWEETKGEVNVVGVPAFFLMSNLHLVKRTVL